jgi:hypothetical protein
MSTCVVIGRACDMVSPPCLKEAPGEAFNRTPLGAKPQGVKGAEPTLRLERGPTKGWKTRAARKILRRSVGSVFAMDQTATLCHLGCRNENSEIFTHASRTLRASYGICLGALKRTYAPQLRMSALGQ